MNRFIQTGKITSVHGVKGEVKAEPWCDSPDDLAEYPRLYIDGGDTLLPVSCARVQKNMVILKLEGVDTVEQAAEYRGKLLYIDRNDIELDGCFFIADLIGLTVVDADKPNIQYGKITQVTSNGAHDVYHITDDNGKLRLIPAIDDVVISTDIDQAVMVIRPLKGLFDDED